MKKYFVVLICVCICMFAGCAGPSDTLTFEENRELRKEKINTSIDEDKRLQDQLREEAGVTEANIEKVKSSHVDRYAYSVMDPKLQDLYSEIYLILCAEAEDVKITSDDPDDIAYVFSCILADHPEIYWVEGYQYVTHEIFGKLSYKTFSGKYIYTKDERRSFQISINDYVGKCTAGIRSNASDYEKVKYVYEYVINNTDYVVGSPDNQNILSVMRNGKSVCQGYAKTVQYLLNKLGIECCTVTGTAANEGHAWNLVKIDGEYYYVDATWGDSSYIINNLTSSVDLDINYDYLNITTDDILKDHEFNNAFSLPICISTSNNYYIKEGLYFTEFDDAAMEYIFTKAYAEGKNVVTIKCANMDVFYNFKTILLDNQKIFDYITNSETINYSANEHTYIMNFWL